MRAWLTALALMAALVLSSALPAAAQTGGVVRPPVVPSTAPSTPPSPAAKPGAPRTITWEDLTPRDWDPMKDLRGLDFGILQDSDPRAQAMLRRLREVWDNAPTNPRMDGQLVRLPGFVVPLEEGKDGLLEFLLVPYFGACIHTPPPPANQIVHVLPRSAAKFRSMETVWVSGTMRTVRTDSLMGVASYRLEATTVEAYTEKPR